MAETRSHRRTLRPGSSSLARTHGEAERALAALSKDYLNWVGIELDNIEGAFEKFLADTDSEQKMQRLDYVFKISHDMKGQGGSFGYPLISDICDRLCRLVVSRDMVGQQKIHAIRAHIDSLAFVLAEDIRGDGGAAGAKLISRLELVTHQQATSR